MSLKITFFSILFSLGLFVSTAHAEVYVNVVTTSTCDGSNSGTATANATGGWAPYTYLWSNGATTETISNLAPGTYTVTVTDMDHAFSSASGTVADGMSLEMNASFATCPVSSDGTATVTVTGGVGPLTYAWSDGQTFVVAYNLAAGDYSVTVTDANGCTAVGNVTVENSPESVWLMPSSTDADCGMCNGTADPHAMLGQQPYTYLWSDGQTTAIATGLCAGTYTVTVTDQSGCANSAEVTVNGNSNLTLSSSQTDATCGQNNGSATVMVTGGSGSYTYSWSNGQTTATANNLSAGNHTVTVTDAEGCTGVITVTIGNSGNINLTSSSTDATCGSNIGSATVTATGGTTPYSYLWDDGQTTATASNLSAGSHSVTVSDASGCSNTTTVTVNQGTGTINVTATGTDATCGNNNGTATATPTSGTAPYTYNWSNGATTSTITNLAGGTYTVTVTDATGCSNTATATVNSVDDNPTVSISPSTSTICKGSDLQMTATTTGSSLTYSWTATGGTFSDATISNPVYSMNTPGTYTLTLTVDAGGCTASATATVTVEEGPTVHMVPCAEYSCTGEDIAVSVDHATSSPGLTYMWTATGGTFSDPTKPATKYHNTVPGVYTITLTGTDPAYGCVATDTRVITVLNLASEVTLVDPLSECGASDAKISATVTGGTGTYSYEWSNGVANQSMLTGLGAGTYTVTITDLESRCETISSITIESEGKNIGNFVWYDSNENCKQDSGETGIGLVPVHLKGFGPDGLYCTADDVTIETQYTDGDGHYEFKCVPEGSYYIQFDALLLNPDYEYTCKNGADDLIDSDADPVTGKTDPFNVTNGPNDYSFDAGIFPKCQSLSTGGKICCDQEICAGERPATLTSVTPAGGLSAKPVEYLWMCSTVPGPFDRATWDIVPNSNSETLDPDPVYITKFFIRCARSQGCVNYNAESNIVAIKVISCNNFVNVSGLQVGNNSVELSWLTNGNDNDTEYAVMFSKDGNTFKEIYRMSGNDGDAKLNMHKFVDKDAKIGYNYYQIAMIKNNVITKSNIYKMILRVNNTDQFVVYPNPAIQNINIENYSEEHKVVTIDVYDMQGKKFEKTMKFDNSITTTKSMSIGDLPNGTYILRFQYDNGKIETHKFTKF